jgi:hypothetical protein
MADEPMRTLDKQEATRHLIQLGEGIAYYQGNDFGGSNALNEILVVTECEDGLAFSAQMGTFAYGRMKEGLNVNQLSPNDGAEYLWRRFVSSLE